MYTYDIWYVEPPPPVLCFGYIFGIVFGSAGLLLAFITLIFMAHVPFKFSFFRCFFFLDQNITESKNFLWQSNILNNKNWNYKLSIFLTIKPYFFSNHNIFFIISRSVKSFLSFVSVFNILPDVVFLRIKSSCPFGVLHKNNLGHVDHLYI